MMILVVGGSGSGKSAYAESRMEALAPGKGKYYIATMKIWDKEGEKKVERHRRMRSGKGFVTIEQPEWVGLAVSKMEAGSSALLECLSNLAANEMFSDDLPEGVSYAGAEETADRIMEGVKVLKEHLTDLVIVSCNVFDDGISYDEGTMEYIRALGDVNERLAALADEVVEVVAGIPNVLKKGA